MEQSVREIFDMNDELYEVTKLLPQGMLESIALHGFAANNFISHFGRLGYEVLGSGSDRITFALNDYWVAKISQSSDHYQSLEEFYTYNAMADKYHITKILSSESLAAEGIIIAERVGSFYDYLHSLLPDNLDTTDAAYAIEQFHANNKGSDNLYYEAGEYIGDDVFADIEHFIEYVYEYDLEDMYTDNIGVRANGTIVALDLGLGSSNPEGRSR